MSLRQCPDCGKEVSSSARACPNCGRPRNSRSLLSVELVAGLSLTIACVLALSWQSAWWPDSASAGAMPAAPPETMIARPYRSLDRSLTAVISYNRTLKLFRVENRDAFSWTDCQVSLNSHGVSGYDLALKAIKPGLTYAALLQSADFVDSDGHAFDPSTGTVTTLDLDCESPQGRLYFGGRFQPPGAGAPLALR